MPRNFRIVYFAHSIRSDWNNGNAHFLRGLLRSLGKLGHDVIAFEPADEWSIRNLREDIRGEQSQQQFAQVYPDLCIETFRPESLADTSYWLGVLREVDIVIVHEWNTPQLAHRLLELREALGFQMLFHDTHHRASSSPEQIELFRIPEFDGVLAFGEVLRTIYRERFSIDRVWTLHEAADTSVFHPLPEAPRDTDCVWIGNWGEGERSAEIHEFLLSPARNLSHRHFCVYGVRYPETGIEALREADVEYSGYLPNLEAPRVYAASRVTVHIPRQQYTQAMTGIPTIRVFEALACGIPLISAPWRDSEGLFREGDFAAVRDCAEMTKVMEHLLTDPAAANTQALQGLQSVLARHTCGHRAEQLTFILEELVQ